MSAEVRELVTEYIQAVSARRVRLVQGAQMVSSLPATHSSA